MINELAAAQFAANAYSTSRDVTSAANEIAIPSEWTVALSEANPASGFLARAYTDQTFVWLADGPDWYAGLTTEGTLSVGGALLGCAGDAGDFIDAGAADECCLRAHRNRPGRAPALCRVPR